MLAAALGLSVHAEVLPGDFVYLRKTDPTIQQDIRYAAETNFTARGVPGYLAGECVLRGPAALALKRVQSRLKGRGLSLKVYDCYRPQKAVNRFMEWADRRTTPDLRLQYYPRLQKDRLIPLGYIATRSGHSKGLTVDLTVVEEGTAQPEIGEQTRYGACDTSGRIPDNSIDMGTGFDCFDELSHTANGEVSPAARENRALLVELMAGEGFRNYAKEWWHFTYQRVPPGSIYYDFDIMPME